MGVIPADPKTLMERNYQVTEKKDSVLHEQEEDFIYDDEDDTFTVSDENCQNSLL